MTWEIDVNRYARALYMLDRTDSVRGIEFCHEIMKRIRDKYPNQSKIFDMMDRENPA